MSDIGDLKHFVGAPVGFVLTAGAGATALTLAGGGGVSKLAALGSLAVHFKLAALMTTLAGAVSGPGLLIAAGVMFAATWLIMKMKSNSEDTNFIPGLKQGSLLASILLGFPALLAGGAYSAHEIVAMATKPYVKTAATSLAKLAA